MAQVKFYAKTSLPTENIDQNGVYFIQGGELYKGSQRFGLGRITKATTAAELAALTGVARGDINVGFEGAKVYDGSAWQKLGGDVADIRAIVSSMTSGLAVGGNGSYITGITQDENGNVTATAEAFPTLDTGDNAGEVKLGTDAAKVAGWDALVGSVSTNASNIASLGTTIASVDDRVSGIESIVNVDNGGTVTASTGNFTNLNVSNTATFSATTVSATSLTVNGSTIEQLADKQIGAISESTVTSSAAGITVGVTTKGGSVTAVSLNAESFTNVMHFLGVGTVEKTAGGVNVTPPAGKTPKVGDIVIDSTSGLEAICTNVTEGDTPTYTWELIGDNATYALNAYSSEATVYGGVTTVPGALNAAGAAIDTLNTNIATKASAGTATATAVAGIGGTVTFASDAAPTFTMTVDPGALKTALGLKTAAYVDTATTVTSDGTDLPTQSAVHKFVTDLVSDLTSTVSGSDGNVSVTVEQTNGKLTACTVAFEWL